MAFSSFRRTNSGDAGVVRLTTNTGYPLRERQCALDRHQARHSGRGHGLSPDP